jgi:multiple sugar transport system substrate-binding protein
MPTRKTVSCANDLERIQDIEEERKQEGDICMNKRLFLSLLLILALALVACGGDEEEAEEPAAEEETAAEEPAEEMAEEPAVSEINILWAQWDPADYLQEVGNMYEAETGITVNISQEPWGSFGDLFFTEMAATGDAWDMVVVDLTDFLVGEGIADTVTSATLTYYGEYPTGSGRYWAFPTEGDADGWAYRKDLFEDPDEMSAFESAYGYALAVPGTYEEFWDIANFFTRPDEGLYGVAIYTQMAYDAITMGVENTMFSWGADWKDENNNVLGIVNSPEAVDSVQFYRDLYECCQVPGLSDAFFTETNDALISGQAVMAMNYFAFFPALASSEVNPYADVTGYFVNPAGPGGAHHAALGGQGMSIINYIDDDRKEASRDFIRWFAQEDIQAEWGRLGGYTCNENVLATQEFLDATPFNPAFAETMGIVKDFWNVPVYAELLTVAQQELGNFVVAGEGTAQEAMDNIAQQHDEILRDAGLITE